MGDTSRERSVFKQSLRLLMCKLQERAFEQVQEHRPDGEWDSARAGQRGHQPFRDGVAHRRGQQGHRRCLRREGLQYTQGSTRGQLGFQDPTSVRCETRNLRVPVLGMVHCTIQLCTLSCTLQCHYTLDQHIVLTRAKGGSFLYCTSCSQVTRFTVLLATPSEEFPFSGIHRNVI